MSSSNSAWRTSAANAALRDLGAVEARKATARTLLANGKSWREIHAAVVAKHGIGIGKGTMLRLAAGKNSRLSWATPEARAAASKLVAEGKTNQQIRETLRAQFGCGIGYRNLARLRAARPQATPRRAVAHALPRRAVAQALLSVTDALSGLSLDDAARVLSWANTLIGIDRTSAVTR